VSSLLYFWGFDIDMLIIWIDSRPHGNLLHLLDADRLRLRCYLIFIL
jgi:hypothetical protein